MGNVKNMSNNNWGNNQNRIRFSFEWKKLEESLCKYAKIVLLVSIKKHSKPSIEEGFIYLFRWRKIHNYSSAKRYKP